MPTYPTVNIGPLVIASATTWTPGTASFVTIPLTSSDANWSGNTYVAPFTGTYLCVVKVRLQDSYTVERGLAIGVDSNNDGTAAEWFIHPNNAIAFSRDSFSTTRMCSFTRGDAIRAYTFSDTSTTFTRADFSLIMLRRD